MRNYLLMFLLVSVCLCGVEVSYSAPPPFIPSPVEVPTNTAESETEYSFIGIVLGISIIFLIAGLFIGGILFCCWLVMDVQSYEDLVSGLQAAKAFFSRWGEIFSQIWARKGIR